MVARVRRGSFLALLGALCACAGNPPVDVVLPRLPVRTDAPAVRLGPVRDARVFTRLASDGVPMSLAPGVADDPAITARIVGRRRSAQGISQDNVFLVEGREVGDLISDATRLALERAGYRVLEPGEPGFADAPALALLVRRFWIRMVWRRLLSYEIRAEVHVAGPVSPFTQGAWVCADVNISRAGPSPGVWPAALRAGLEDYANNVFERLAWRSLPVHCGRISRPGQPGPPEGGARLRPSSSVTNTRPG